EWQHRTRKISAQSPRYKSLGFKPSSHTCEVLKAGGCWGYIPINLPLALNTPYIWIADHWSRQCTLQHGQTQTLKHG
ncbi:hypothetical protein H5410_002387, partial [Solanum commersonii]